MKVVVVYNFPIPAHGPEHQLLASRFVASVLTFPPNYPHSIVVASSGGPPTGAARALFSVFPNAHFIETNDEGWDVGNFVKVSHQVECDALFCCGGPCYFRRSGWLKRIADVWQKYGPGFYGTLATYEVRPHINTTGFACPPSVLRTYPRKIVDRGDRYEFEHGENACYVHAQRMGLPVLLVTWNHEFTRDQWRMPPNGYRKGDQSDCVSYWKHTDLFEQADPQLREAMTRLADGIK